jgi:hypothetical protein
MQLHMHVVLSRCAEFVLPTVDCLLVAAQFCCQLYNQQNWQQQLDRPGGF